MFPPPPAAVMVGSPPPEPESRLREPMITDAAHPTPDQLAAFDAGTLPDPVRERVERHVVGCETCCRLLESLPEDPLSARVRSLAVPVVPDELRDHPRVEIL